MMAWLQGVTLHSDRVTLAPLAASHVDALIEAASDGELWSLWYTHVPRPQDMAAEIARRRQLQDEGAMLPFAVIDNAIGTPVGMTNFMNVDAPNRRVEIGGTWYRRGVQRTGLNTHAKQLLLTHAFESLDCIAVELRTHFFNHQSRRAIERLGAKLDGILRNHQIAGNGTLRDTCVYSIVAAEWPTVKAHLAWQIARPRGR